MTIIVVGRSTTHPAQPDSPVDDYRVLEVVDADHWRIEFEEPPPDPIAEMQATIDALLDALGGSDG